MILAPKPDPYEDGPLPPPLDLGLMSNDIPRHRSQALERFVLLQHRRDKLRKNNGMNQQEALCKDMSVQMEAIRTWLQQTEDSN